MMSAEADAKFPQQSSGARGPGSSAENPAGVFPKSNPKPDPDPPSAHQEGSSIFQSIENPYALREALTKLESGLDEVISLFQAEKNTLAKEGSFSKGKEAMQLFESWKQHLERIKAGQE